MNDEKYRKNEIIDLKYIINLFSEKWLWFGISLFAAIFIAAFINITAQRIYKVSTFVVINEENNGIGDASSQLLREIGFLSTSKNFANELLVLKSTPLIDRAIQGLDFQISYFEKTRFQKKELYKSSPFIVVLNPEHPQPVNCEFFIKIIDKNSFELSVKQRNVGVVSLSTNQLIQEIDLLKIKIENNFNQSIKSENYNFKIILNSNFNIENLRGNQYSFIINTHRRIVKSFQRSLDVLPPDLESTVAQISLTSSTPQKAKDFLNSLTQTYSENVLNKKKHISIKTIEYINNQLGIIKDSLQLAEENLQQFRSRNELIDITVQSGYLFDELSDLENQRAILEINMKYYEYIEEYFNSNQEYSELIAPSAMGIEDPMLNSLIEELITLNAERASLVENNQEKSPYLKKINIRIENLKNMVSENINYYKQTNKIALDDLDSRINQINNEVRKLPRTQRELLGYERKFNINDAIYTYLLEKKSEAEIANASYQSDIEIMEPAEVEGLGPISPKKKLNLIIAIFLGLVVPLSYFRIVEFMRKTVSSRNEIERLTNKPILGSIFHNNKKTELVVSGFPQSHIAESFRKIRTNLNFFLPMDETKVIGISSTISQEGKSFISLNLANSLAIANNKTILLAFDLRKPRKYTNLDLKEGPGLTAYLSNQAALPEVLQHTNIPNLDVIPAGEVPPNPAELIASNKTNELLQLLSQDYEYIIIDTAPIGILSESSIVLKLVHLKIIVIRLNTTPKSELNKVLGELEALKIDNLCLLINDMKLSGQSKYGYGYYIENVAKNGGKKR